jgi:hypothetical protein
MYRFTFEIVEAHLFGNQRIIRDQAARRIFEHWANQRQKYAIIYLLQVTRPGGEIGRLRGLKNLNTLVNTNKQAGCSKDTKKCPARCNKPQQKIA